MMQMHVFFFIIIIIAYGLQKKEARLDVMMDKLRQESTEEALQAALEQILKFLEEIKEG